MGWFGIWIGLLTAHAEGVHVVRAGETVAQVAASLGLVGSAGEIARLNEVGVTEPLVPGTVLKLPAGLDPEGGCQPSFVFAAHGTGRVHLPGGGSRALVPRLMLPEESRVCTDEDSTATLRLALGVADDGWNDVLLMPSTCVTVRSSYLVQGQRRSFVSLASGALTVAGPATGDSEVAVQTDAGIAVGAGGFRVRRGEALTLTEAVEREVATLAQGQTVDLDVGFGNRTADGLAPGEPVPLLPPALATAPAEGAPVVSLDLRWSGPEVAVGYFVTVALDRSFLEVVHRKYVQAAERYAPRMMTLPATREALWWRVTAVDRVGLEGLPSDRRSLLGPFTKPTE